MARESEVGLGQMRSFQTSSGQPGVRSDRLGQISQVKSSSQGQIRRLVSSAKVRSVQGMAVQVGQFRPGLVLFSTGQVDQVSSCRESVSQFR